MTPQRTQSKLLNVYKDTAVQNIQIPQVKSVFMVLLSLLVLFSWPVSKPTHAIENPTVRSTEKAGANKLVLAYRKALKDWSYVLEHYVDEQGRTDFKALSKDIAPLENVVSFVGFASPSMTPKLFDTPQKVMAYHINAYNALAMYGVIEEGIPNGFTNFFSRAGFFKFRDVVIGGKVTNLYDYENEVIRPLNEPRAHFALNCMVKDCPRLPQQPFYPDTLDETLEQATYEFFSKKRHFYLDNEKKRAYVSEILDFYTEDFVPSGKAKDLPQYINQYLKTPIPKGYKLRFIDYDWRINAQPEREDTNTVLDADTKQVNTHFELAAFETTRIEPKVLRSTQTHTTMLELYTSQGCSSCPPAEKWLSGFVDSRKLWTELVPINFHVDYWDYLGWKDPFANKAFSHRQRKYKLAKKTNTIATPGFTLNGRGWNGWFRGQPLPQRIAPLSGELEALIESELIEVSFDADDDIDSRGENLNNTPSSIIAHAALLGFGINTAVRRGENAGRQLAHDFVVIDYEQQKLNRFKQDSQNSNGNQNTYNYKGRLPIPNNTQVETTQTALVVWVSRRGDPSPIQVAASWWEQ